MMYMWKIMCVYALQGDSTAAQFETLFWHCHFLTVPLRVLYAGSTWWTAGSPDNVSIYHITFRETCKSKPSAVISFLLAIQSDDPQVVGFFFSRQSHVFRPVLLLFQESPMPSTTLWEPLEVQRDVTVGTNMME